MSAAGFLKRVAQVLEDRGAAYGDPKTQMEAIARRAVNRRHSRCRRDRNSVSVREGDVPMAMDRAQMRLWADGLAAVVAAITASVPATARGADDPLAWPRVTRECRPWT